MKPRNKNIFKNGLAIAFALFLSFSANAQLTLSNSYTNIFCNGGATDDTLFASGGSSPYMFNVNGGIYSTNDIYSLTAGTYTFTVQDALSATSSIVVTISQPTPVVASTTFTPPFCFGGSNGSAIGIGSGGITYNGIPGATADYIYEWYDVNFTQLAAVDSVLDNITAGTYNLVVEDFNGCRDTASNVVVTQPSLVVGTVTSTPPSCFGASNGELMAAATGGVSYNGIPGATFDYIYDWYDGVYNQVVFNDSVLTNITAGQYYVVIEDFNGCRDTLSQVLSQPNLLTAIISNTSPFCFGESNGMLTAAASGGTSYNGIPGATFDYIYDWYDNVYNQLVFNDSVLNNVTAGDYHLVVEDFNGCRDTISSNLTQPTQLNVLAAFNAPLCFGGNTGSAAAVASGGVSYNGIPGATFDYIYDWYDNAYNQLVFNDSNLTNITSGNYFIVGEDFNGCRDTATISVTEPPLLVASSSITSSVLCNGGNAVVEVSATGGTPAYSNIGNNTVTAGTYNYTVTDANGCTATTSITVSEPTVLVASSAVTSPVLCNGGNAVVEVSATGGTPAYSNIGNNTVTAGTYNYTVTDANGCTATTSITVSEPTVLVASSAVTSPVLCNGGNAIVEVSAIGGTPAYSNIGNNTVTAGTYNYTVTDANGCTATTSITVSEPTVLVASSAVTSPVLCNGGNAVVEVSATGGTPAYSNIGNNTVTAGTYNYTVTDANGCTATTSIVITEPTALVISAIVTQPHCFGDLGSVVLAASGATPAYTFSSGAITNLAAGIYTYLVTDANACSVSTSVTINQAPPQIAINISTPNTTINAATTLALTASAAVPVTSFAWTSPSYPSFTGNPLSFIAYIQDEGIYSVVATDANGCTESSTIEIFINNGIKLNLKALLSGPLTSSGLMNDALRQAGLIPNSDPYALNTTSNPYSPVFTHVNGGGELIDPGVLSNAGNDAIVDWVFIQLRDKNNSSTILYTRSALIQRDGDIVDMDGVSPVFFPNTTPDLYYVTLKHRNHLGIMTLNTNNLSLTPTAIDFTNVSTPLYTNPAPGNNASIVGVQTRIIGGKRALFAGNCNISLANAANRYIVFNNSAYSDRTSLFNYAGFTGAINGYSIFDLDLNGSATFNSLNPDRLVMLINCSNITGLFVNEQTPN